jgi:hypothetical protein
MFPGGVPSPAAHDGGAAFGSGGAGVATEVSRGSAVGQSAAVASHAVTSSRRGFDGKRDDDEARAPALQAGFGVWHVTPFGVGRLSSCASLSQAGVANAAASAGH